MRERKKIVIRIQRRPVGMMSDGYDLKMKNVYIIKRNDDQKLVNKSYVVYNLIVHIHIYV